jgi:hypothetical protein
MQIINWKVLRRMRPRPNLSNIDIFLEELRKPTKNPCPRFENTVCYMQVKKAAIRDSVFCDNCQENYSNAQGSKKMCAGRVFKLPSKICAKCSTKW